MIADQLLIEELGVEHINAHTGQRFVRLTGYRRGLRRFFGKAGDLPGRVDAHHAEGGGFRQRNFQTSHRHIRPFFDMLGQQFAVIHPVDVIAAQNHDVLGIVTLHDVDVLKNGIGGALIPGFIGGALLRREQFDEFLETPVEKTPAMLDMADQALCFVLRYHADAPETGIDAIGKRKVDDAEFAAERNCRFGAPIGQLMQAAAAPAREYQRQRIVRDAAVKMGADLMFRLRFTGLLRFIAIIHGIAPLLLHVLIVLLS